MQVMMLDIPSTVIAVNHCWKVLELIKQPCSIIMIFSNPFYFKFILYVLIKLYMLFFRLRIVLLLLYYFSFSFILELLNGFEMFLRLDMIIQKIDKSWFENRRMILLENYSIHFVSQFQSPFANADAKNRENDVLELFISP